MRYSFFYLIFLFFIWGCTSDKTTPPAPVIKVPQLATFEGSSIRIQATEPYQLIESQIILTDDNKPIPNGTQFRLVADTVKIGDDNVNWLSTLIVSSNEGKISFYVKPHTVAGLYRVNAYPVESSNIKFDQGLNARYFINVVPGPPYNLGEIKTDFFEDTPSYNNQKNSNESWIVASSPDIISYISVGPISDIYGNLIDEGNLNFTTSQGTILSENPSRVLSGYSYFAYKSDGPTGLFNASASINDLSLSSSIKKASPQLALNRHPDFTSMTIGQSRCETLILSNSGAMPATNLDVQSSFPFLLLDNQTSDSLCPITSNECTSGQTLRSGETCSLRVKFTMPSTSVVDGELSIQMNPQEYSSSLLIEKLRTQSVQVAQLVSSNPFISFGGTQCSTSRTVDIYVQNVGDFDATGIVVQNPPPNANQSNPFYSIILPSQDIPMNSNLNSIVNCGTTFPAGRKCRVQIQFNPSASVTNQALIGKILGDNINPLILSVSGYTIPGNALNTFPINFVTPNNSILPLGMSIGNAQQSRVDIGPIVDACNQKVVDGSIITANVSAGNLLQQTLVSNNGFVSFLWNSGTDISKLGNQSIDVSVGVNGSKSGTLFFRGVNLQLSGISQLNQVIEGKPKDTTLTLTNNGNVIAQNLSMSANYPLIIVDKGDCSLNQLNPQSSCQIVVRADPQGINQDLSIPVMISSSSIGNNNTSLNILLNARTKAILSLDKINYLFNDGTSQSIYTKNITVTNNGPAISYDTSFSVESPFFIQSSTCSSTLAVNSSCTVEVALNQSDAGLASNKLFQVSNEIDIGAPSAVLEFSHAQLNAENIKTIQNRCSGPYNMSVVGSSGVIPILSNSNFSLASGSGTILFYSDSNCSVSTSSVTINSGSSISSDFYVKNPNVISDIIIVSNPVISSGSSSIQFNSEINLTLPNPNGLVSTEFFILESTGGYSGYTYTFIDGSTDNAFSFITDEVDGNSDPTGKKMIKAKTISSVSNAVVRVTDSLGFYKDFTFNFYPEVTSSGSVSVFGNDPVSIPYNDYGNPNAKSFVIQRLSGFTYIDGSAYGSTIDSNGNFTLGNSAPSTSTEYVLVKVAKNNGNFSSVRVQINIQLSWPYGTLGDLVINSGQTVYLTYGQTYDYRNITINSGGTLVIDNPNLTSTSNYLLTTIGISGNLVNNGYIYAPQVNLNFWAGYTVGYNFNIPRLSMSDFYTVSTTFIQREGGYGSAAVYTSGGSPVYGNGGGGGGHEGYSGGSASFSQAGNGGNARPCGTQGIGGAGGTVTSKNGVAGTYGYYCYSGYGAGGGGGFRGSHSAPMAFKIKGSISGNGVISASGGTGGTGANGGVGLYYGVSGGSGAGGMGSPIWFYLRNSYSNFNNIFSINTGDSSKISVYCLGGSSGSVLGSAQGINYGQSGDSCTPTVVNF